MAEDDFIRMRLRKLELRRFSTGGTPPQLLAARAYPNPNPNPNPNPDPSPSPYG